MFNPKRTTNLLAMLSQKAKAVDKNSLEGHVQVLCTISSRKTKKGFDSDHRYSSSNSLQIAMPIEDCERDYKHSRAAHWRSFPNYGLEMYKCIYCGVNMYVSNKSSPFEADDCSVNDIMSFSPKIKDIKIYKIV